MLYEVELRRIVVFHADELPLPLDSEELVSKRLVITRLLQNLLKEKADEDLGYFLAVTCFNKISRGRISQAGNSAFNVQFNCRMFLPRKGDILEGVVCNIVELGVLLRCGPVKHAFLSARKMPSYHYVAGDYPLFLRDDLAKIENNVVVRFEVFAVRWDGIRKEFRMLASIEGDSLGPVTLPGSDGLVC